MEQILIVGAGAVGQCYGFYLHRAGYKITFLVKPHHRSALSDGVNVLCFNGPSRGEHRFSEYALIDDVRNINPNQFGQVWLAVSSTALAGQWLSELLHRIGSANVICLQPGADAQALVRQYVPQDDRFIAGLIGVISYAGPLRGEWGQPGIRWWHPPFSASLFQGPVHVTTSIVDALKQSGCPAKRSRHVRKVAWTASAYLLGFVGALELSNWSFKDFLKPQPVARFKATVADMLGSIPWFHRLALGALCRPVWLKCAALLIRRVAPFDIDAYLEAHFKKVADQTRAMVKFYLDSAERQGRTVPHLDQLYTQLRAQPNRSSTHE